MTRNSKRELLEAIRPRYLRASKADKTRILDEFVATTDYHRKHAIRLLKHGAKASRKKKPGKSKIYQGEVVIALIKIWAICGQICSRRLHPFVPEMVAPAQFEQQMALLSSEGYCSISLNEFIAMPRQGTIPAGKYFVLTFDDGYRDNYLMAFPILQKFGFKATVFLVSDWLLQGHDGREVPTLVLRLEDIAEMSRGGIAFGAHTCNHRSLIALSPEEAQLEIRGSKEVLENYLNQPIRFFSYPYGHSNPHIRSTVRASGFAGACSNHRSSDDLFNLRRTMVHRDDSLLDFRLKVWGWDVWLLQALKRLESQLPSQGIHR